MAMAMPGAHDAAVGPQLEGLYPQYGSAQTQSLTIPALLVSGTRYLDLRVSLDPPDVIMVHGIFRLHLTLDGVVGDMIIFLASRGKQKTILVSLKRDGDTGSDNPLWTKVSRVIGNLPSYWYQDTSVPNQDEARGRIVFFRR